MQFIAADQCRAMEVAIAAEWKKHAIDGANGMS